MSGELFTRRGRSGTPMIRVASNEEAEKADYVVCMPAASTTPFDDNESGTCCWCGCAIIFRPHVPKTPPKICLPCLTAMMEHRKQ